ncbi:MAG TPA: uracil-DNA glycosylase [Patescibacteria group bacterium]|nr:uracil-DNA glycosylase [Patescibacteria group bacterium]
MDKQQVLIAINAKWERQCVCTLRTSAKQAVPGDGSADADIVFIGEAPGKNEDEQGKPFVGAAGKFLNEMLASIQMKRADIYITNIVKYRPPNNRDPLPEEIIDCQKWLSDQIKTIQPKIIVTLGRHALEHFLPGKKISEVHGKAFRRTLADIGTQVFFALYHPAAALYNGSMRATLIKDFHKIPLVLKKIK